MNASSPIVFSSFPKSAGLRPLRIGLCATLWIAAAATPGFGQGTVIQRDTFDDGDLTKNTRGIGLASGWKQQKSGIATGAETAGGYEVSVGKEHSSHALTAQGDDRTFAFWNKDGVTITWVIESMTVVTPHKFGGPFAFHWDFGIVSADETGPKWPYRASGSAKGGFFIFIGKKDAGPACQVRVEVYNKNVAKVEPFPGDPGMAQVVNYSADLEFPLTVTATLNHKNWSVQVANVRHRGNWTKDLTDGDLRDAEITTEFERGAYLFLHGRNSGITGEKITFPANSGKLRSVTVTANTPAQPTAPAK
jgi:hypothetical protein